MWPDDQIGKGGAQHCIAINRRTVDLTAGIVSSDATARAGKRSIVEGKHLNDADRKEPQLNKVCPWKHTAVLDTTFLTFVAKSCVANSDNEGIVSDVHFGNAVLFPKTNTLNPALEGEALVTLSNKVNFPGMDLRSVIMKQRNKKVVKLSERSRPTITSRKNECEDDNLRWYDDEENEMYSRRWRSRGKGRRRRGRPQSCRRKCGVGDKDGVSAKKKASRRNICVGSRNGVRAKIK